jgi:hypothetical protein
VSFRQACMNRFDGSANLAVLGDLLSEDSRWMEAEAIGFRRDWSGRQCDLPSGGGLAT